MRTRFIGGLAAIALLAGSSALLAQRSEPFTARLTWVPISGGERDDVAGHGSATATLVGSRLSIAGSFEGLPAAATAARLHHGVAKGARGPAIAELSLTKTVDGTLAGEVDLTADQLAALQAGRLYVQVHSEKGVPPDNGNLWGWLLR